MKKMMLVEHDELLSHAISIGYSRVRAIRIFFDDEIPGFGAGTASISKKDVVADEYEYWSEDSKQIVLSFMEQHKLEEFLLS